MDWVGNSQKIIVQLKKYRYVWIVLLAGLFLMLLPEKQEGAVQTEHTYEQTSPVDLQSELEVLLCQLEGAGKVRVLLTESAGERTLYQTDESMDSGENSQSIRRDTVVVTDSSRNENGLILQTLPPVYLGAVVLCQGADSAAVKLAIIEAVSSATGLATHHISVLKMK